jgi:hypothetical protein
LFDHILSAAALPVQMTGKALGVLVLITGCIVEEEGPELATQASALAAAWSAPARIAAVSALGYYESDPAISADGLELYFTSDRGGARRIYMSTRFSTASAWTPAVPVPALSGWAGTYDYGPELSHDGLTIWFSRAVAGQPGPQLYTATRAIRSLGWSAPTLVEELATVRVSSPHVSQDGLALYFSSADAAIPDIYIANRPSLTDTWRNVRTVNRFNSGALDEAPTTARAEREAYFDSARGGALRVYRSTRTLDTGWSIPAVVDELAGASRVDVTPDAAYMVMMIAPNGGDPDIYESRR